MTGLTAWLGGLGFRLAVIRTDLAAVVAITLVVFSMSVAGLGNVFVADDPIVMKTSPNKNPLSNKVAENFEIL